MTLFVPIPFEAIPDFPPYQVVIPQTVSGSHPPLSRYISSLSLLTGTYPANDTLQANRQEMKTCGHTHAESFPQHLCAAELSLPLFLILMNKPSDVVLSMSLASPLFLILSQNENVFISNRPLRTPRRPGT